MTVAPKYLRRKEAADYLRNNYGYGSTATLAKLAVIGGGPIYTKVGSAPLYTADDLDTWMRSRMTGRRKSTSVVLDDAPPTGSSQTDEVAA